MPEEDNYPCPAPDIKWNGTANKKNKIVRWIFHETDSGVTSLVSRAKLRRGKWIKGNLKYTYLGITEILKWRKRNAWVKIDDKSPVIINFSLFVFTLSEFFGGGYWVAPGASPIKNHAYLCKAWNLTRLQMLLLMGPLRKGKHIGKWGITLTKCKKLEIKSVNQENEPVDIAHDPPPIFIVAPKGRTNDDTSSLTPNSSSHLSIVTGSVAPLELVENASNCAGPIPVKNVFKGIFTYTFNMVIYVTNKCIISPTTTAII